MRKMLLPSSTPHTVYIPVTYNEATAFAFKALLKE
jgi:hypothetical protein